MPALPRPAIFSSRLIESEPLVISRDEFDVLVAKGHTRIPLVREVFSDLDTPLSVYLKLADGRYTFLFESVEGGSTWGRYSIIGLPARRVYRLRGHELEVEDSGEVTERRHVADPLAEIEVLRQQYDVPQLPEDLDALLGACQDPEIQRWTPLPSPYLPEHAELFVAACALRWVQGLASFAIQNADESAFLGSIGFVGLPEEGVVE